MSFLPYKFAPVNKKNVACPMPLLSSPLSLPSDKPTTIVSTLTRSDRPVAPLFKVRLAPVHSP